MFHSRVWLAIGLFLLMMCAAQAQLSTWQIGGSGLEWSGSDTLDILIDFETAPTAIQPVYISPDSPVFSYIPGWSDYRVPRDLGFVNGEQPRAWRNYGGNVSEGYRGSYLVDGDSTTYNPPTSAYGALEWYTIDLAVPVPANRFGFYTPSQGFRADGYPLQKDAVPAFEISISPDAIPSWMEEGDYPQIGVQIADVQENFDTKVKIDFLRQYVRFIRYKRQTSTQDLSTVSILDFGTGTAAQGTIGDFELFGEGVPRRVLYTTRILDLGEELNFGRLFWTATPIRRVGDEDLIDPGADVAVEIGVRTGRDDDPNVYYEYTDKGLEGIVSRDRYERELKPAFAGQEGKPGLRASISYDTENWTYWSPPITEPGQPLGLASGSYIQIQITLRSEEFDAFVRLDSVWIERAPLLARQIVGEVARLDDPQPVHGFTEVELGRQIDFVYDLKAIFSDAGEQGFDALRIRTEQPPHFRSLEMGDPLTPVEPQQVDVEDGFLVIHLPQRITPTRNEPVRVTFGTELFAYATTFTGEVFDSTTESLSQPVEAGDATGELATNSLRVLGASGKAPQQLQHLTFSTPVLTPNNDGINDQVEIFYSLFRLPEEVPVQLEVYALDGRQVATLPMGRQTSGLQQILWDGRTAEGALLPPGIYLVNVALRSESISSHQLRPLGIAY